MNEFLNRIDAQRTVLDAVNSYSWDNEPLFGLSKQSLERWVNSNKTQVPEELISLLFKVAEKLFFLANKSQEQITDEYKDLSRDVHKQTQKIKKEISKMR